MNKQNSIATDNEPSTEVNDSLKSYSSRFRQLKTIKSQPKKRNNDVLPYKLQKAAVVIQRFWRFRMSMKRRLYQTLLVQFTQNNKVIQFQNSNIDKLIQISQRNYKMLQTSLYSSAKHSSLKKQQQSKDLIKRMVSLTFQMQKKMIQEQQLNQLEEEELQWRQKLQYLHQEREELKQILSGELHDEEEQFLKLIREENMNLLRISKQKNVAEKIIKERLISLSKAEINL